MSSGLATVPKVFIYKFWFILNMLARGNPLLCSLLVFLRLSINVKVGSTPKSMFLLSKTVLEHCRYVLPLPTDILLEIQQLMLSVRDETFYNPSCYVFLSQANFCTSECPHFCHLCHMIQSNLTHLFCSMHFSFSALCWTVEIVLVAAVSSSLIISSSWCCYHYGWCDQSLGLLFSGFWVTPISHWNMVMFYMWCSCSLKITSYVCSNAVYIGFCFKR